MGLHFSLICDNCGIQEIEYAPRVAFVIKPNEILKRLFSDYRWKKYKDGTVLCQMCANEFSGYQKDNADWFAYAKKDKHDRRPKTRGGATISNEEYRRQKEMNKAIITAEMANNHTFLEQYKESYSEQLTLLEDI